MVVKRGMRQLGIPDVEDPGRGNQHQLLVVDQEVAEENHLKGKRTRQELLNYQQLPSRGPTTAKLTNQNALENAQNEER